MHTRSFHKEIYVATLTQAEESCSQKLTTYTPKAYNSITDVEVRHWCITPKINGQKMSNAHQNPHTCDMASPVLFLYISKLDAQSNVISFAQ